MLQKPSSCNESDGSWLPLIEYSIKSGVSLSTIRRKIKTSSIPFRLEKGKYLILFNDKEQAANSFTQTPVHEAKPAPTAVLTAETKEYQNADSDDESWSMQMISEAFEHALREKEERIRLLERRGEELEQHLNELRLLVKVLEEKYEVHY